MKKSYITFINDVALLGLAMWLALVVTKGGAHLPLLKHLAVFTLLAAGVLLLTESYLRGWKYFTAAEFIGSAKMTTIIVVLYAPLFWLLTKHQPVAYYLPAVTWVMSLLLLTGSRFLYQLSKREQHADGARFQNLLLLGTGAHCERFVRELRSNPDPDVRILGVLTSNEAEVGRYIQEVEVLGQITDLEEVIKQLEANNCHPDTLVVTDSSCTGVRLLEKVHQAQQSGLSLACLNDDCGLQPVAVDALMTESLEKLEKLLKARKPREASKFLSKLLPEYKKIVAVR